MAKSTKSTTRKSTSAGRTSTRRSTTTKSTSRSKSTKAPTITSKAATAAAELRAAAEKKPSSVVSLVPDAPATDAVDAPQTSDDGWFRRQDLIQRVADRSSAKRSDVRDVLEIALEEIGAALDASDVLVLPPLGKVIVKGRRDINAATQLTVKVRRKTMTDDAETGLAEPETDS